MLTFGCRPGSSFCPIGSSATVKSCSFQLPMMNSMFFSPSMKRNQLIFQICAHHLAECSWIDKLLVRGEHLCCQRCTFKWNLFILWVLVCRFSLWPCFWVLTLVKWWTKSTPAMHTSNLVQSYMLKILSQLIHTCHPQAPRQPLNLCVMQ